MAKKKVEEKDKEDKNKWLIDEEAAKTVRYIFKLCADGLGPTQIAKRLQEEKVLTPTAYQLQKSGKLLPPNPFKWAQNTVQEYWSEWNISGILRISKLPQRITAVKNEYGTTKKTESCSRILILLS